MIAAWGGLRRRKKLSWHPCVLCKSLLHSLVSTAIAPSPPHALVETADRDLLDGWITKQVSLLRTMHTSQEGFQAPSAPRLWVGCSPPWTAALHPANLCGFPLPARAVLGLGNTKVNEIGLVLHKEPRPMGRAETQWVTVGTVEGEDQWRGGWDWYRVSSLLGGKVEKGPGEEEEDCVTCQSQMNPREAESPRVKGQCDEVAGNQPGNVDWLQPGPTNWMTDTHRPIHLRWERLGWPGQC